MPGGYQKKVRASREADRAREKKREVQIQQAILTLSLGDADELTWEHAAEWQTDRAEPLSLPYAVEYIKPLGYDAMNGDCWSLKLGMETQQKRPQLRFRLDRHIEKVGRTTTFEQHFSHTWYLIECTLDTKGVRGEFTWQCPRRLAQLRVGLHDPVKDLLAESYADYFADSPFAHHGGVPGTTERLKHWLNALACFLNGENSLPSAVARTLSFFNAHEVLHGGAAQAQSKTSTRTTN